MTNPRELVEVSIRDSFALAAMPALIGYLRGVSGQTSWSVIAEASYALADAMMNARRGPEKQDATSTPSGQ
jgi:hypothetical protein